MTTKQRGTSNKSDNTGNYKPFAFFMGELETPGSPDAAFLFASPGLAFFFFAGVAEICGVSTACRPRFFCPLGGDTSALTSDLSKDNSVSPRRRERSVVRNSVMDSGVSPIFFSSRRVIWISNWRALSRP